MLFLMIAIILIDAIHNDGALIIYMYIYISKARYMEWGYLKKCYFLSLQCNWKAGTMLYSGCVPLKLYKPTKYT